MRKKLLVIVATLVVLVSINVAAYADLGNPPPDCLCITIPYDEPITTRTPNPPPDWD